MSADYALITFEPRRRGLRWVVVQRSAYPNGLYGVAIKPFEHEVRRFWRRQSAITFATSQPWEVLH